LDASVDHILQSVRTCLSLQAVQRELLTSSVQQLFLFFARRDATAARRSGCKVVRNLSAPCTCPGLEFTLLLDSLQTCFELVHCCFCVYCPRYNWCVYIWG